MLDGVCILLSSLNSPTTLWPASDAIIRCAMHIRVCDAYTGVRCIYGCAMHVRVCMDEGFECLPFVVITKAAANPMITSCQARASQIKVVQVVQDAAEPAVP